MFASVSAAQPQADNFDLLLAVVVAVATVANSVVAAGLWRETRSARNEAHVGAELRPFLDSPIYPVVVLRNYGPSLARTVKVTIDLITREGGVIDAARQSFEPEYLEPSTEWTFTLDTGGTTPTTQQLDDDGVQVRVAWEWRDGRRSRLGFGPPAVHRETWIRHMAWIEVKYTKSNALIAKAPGAQLPGARPPRRPRAQ